MRRIYKTMKNRFPEKDRVELRRSVMKECGEFLNSEVTVGGLVKYVKNQLKI